MSVFGTIVEAAGLVADGIQEVKKHRNLEEQVLELREKALGWKKAYEGAKAYNKTLDASHNHLTALLDSNEKRVQILNERVRMLRKEKRALELKLMLTDLPESPYETPEGDLEAAILAETGGTD